MSTLSKSIFSKRKEKEKERKNETICIADALTVLIHPSQASVAIITRAEAVAVAECSAQKHSAPKTW